MEAPDLFEMTLVVSREQELAIRELFVRSHWHCQVKGMRKCEREPTDLTDNTADTVRWGNHAQSSSSQKPQIASDIKVEDITEDIQPVSVCDSAAPSPVALYRVERISTDSEENSSHQGNSIQNGSNRSPNRRADQHDNNSSNADDIFTGDINEEINSSRTIHGHSESEDLAPTQQHSTPQLCSSSTLGNEKTRTCSSSGLSNLCIQQQSEFNSMSASEKNTCPPVVGGEIVDKESRKFHCKNCPQYFDTRSQYRHHLRSHSNAEEAFKCQHCMMEFSVFREYVFHLNSHKNPQNTRKKGLGKSTGSHCRDKKARSTKNTKFTCQKCGRLFDVFAIYKRHMNSHLKEDDLSSGKGSKPHGQLHCTGCGLCFSVVREYILHLNTGCAKKSKVGAIREQHIHKTCDKLSNLNDGENALEPPNKIIHCDTSDCQVIKDDPGKRQPIQCESGNRAINRENGKGDNPRRAIPGGTEVQIIPIKVPTRSRVSSGMNMAFGETSKSYSSPVIEDKDYLCGQCSQKFPTFRELRLHVAVHRSTATEFSGFLQSSLWGQEVLKIRTETSEGHCSRPALSACGKIYSGNEISTEEKTACEKNIPGEETPTGNRVAPYESVQSGPSQTCCTDDFGCEECGGKFSTFRELRVHMIKCRSECDRMSSTGCAGTSSTTPLHLCSYCGKTFKLTGRHREHLRTHTGERPFPCHICQRSFGTKGELDRHLRQHKGEKSHLCTVCGKLFAETNYLKSHLRQHTGEKPFACYICGMAFAQRTSLKIHMKKHEEVSLTPP